MNDNQKQNYNLPTTIAEARAQVRAAQVASVDQLVDMLSSGRFTHDPTRRYARGGWYHDNKLVPRCENPPTASLQDIADKAAEEERHQARQRKANYKLRQQPRNPNP